MIWRACCAPRVGSTGRVLLADINGAMLAHGRDRLLDAGIAGNVDYLQVDAERLPLAEPEPRLRDHRFRPAQRHRQAGRARPRCSACCKPGGRALVLEFSQPVLAPLKPLYDAYSFQVLPRIGRLVAGDADSYRYLAESIRRHPDQDTLLGMLHAAGFSRCQYFNLTGGIVAVHRGYRL